MLVRSKTTGRLGNIPDDKFDANLFEKAGQSDVISSYRQPSTNPIDTTVSVPATQSSGLLSVLGNIFAPRTTGIVQDVGASNQMKQSLPGIQQKNDSNFQQSQQLIKQARQATDLQVKAKLLDQSRSIMETNVSPDISGFSKDIDKSYLERGAKAGLELGSYLAPAGKGLAGAIKMGGVSGGLNALSQDKVTAGNVVGGVAGGAVASGVMHGLLTLGGKLLEGQGEKLTLKALKPSKTQISKFKGKTGEELSDFVRTNNLFENGAEQANSKLETLYSQYDDVANKSGKLVKTSDILGQFDSKIKELSGYAGTQFDTLINSLTAEREAIASKLAGKSEVGLDWVVSNRKMLDKLIPEGAFGVDPVMAGSKKLVRDIYKGVIDTTTEGATKEIGSKIRNFEAFKDIAELQQGLGKGSLPVGLIPLLAGSAGGGVGYASGGKDGAIKGALATYGLTSVINNPKVITYLSKILPSLGKGMEKSADTIIPQILSRTAGQKIGETIGNAGSTTNGGITPVSGIGNYNESQQQVNQNHGDSIAQASNTSLNQQTTTGKTLTGYTPEFIYSKYEEAQADGNKKAADQLYKKWQDETDYQAKVPKPDIKAQDEVKDTIGNIDTILNRNLDMNTGLLRSVGNIPGTSAYDTKRMIEQVKGQLQLASVGKLKGQGQVSDAERKLLADASTALDTGMTKEAFMNELQKVKAILSRSVQ